jgi:hypothetical protein
LPAAGGYTPTERWSLDLVDGRRMFAKRATQDWLAEALRAEYRTLGLIGADRLRCEVLAWDDGECPVLLLEDLRDARWPPPWRTGDVDLVLSTLSRMWALPSQSLPSSASVRKMMSGWPQIAEDPRGFLLLGVASKAWLDCCVHDLARAVDETSFSGDDFLHMDLRSDNMCFSGDRVVFVDWNWACRASAALDLACWLPSLHLEGGPAPEEVAPGLGGYAAGLASYFATNAALPPPPDSPRLRGIQLQQLRITLPWACRELRLPEPDEQ